MSLENCKSWCFDDRARRLLAGLPARYSRAKTVIHCHWTWWPPEVPLHLNYFVIPWNWKVPFAFLFVSDCTPSPLPLCCSGTCIPVWTDSTHYTCRKLIWERKMRLSCAVSRSSVLSKGPINVETSIKGGAGLCDEEWCWKRERREGCGTDLLAALSF